MSEEEVREDEIDWWKFGEPKTDEEIKLQKLDYLAIFIAALQTIFLPFVLLFIVLIAIGLFFGLVF